MARVSIYVTDEMKESMEKWPELNWSAVASKAFDDAMNDRAMSEMALARLERCATVASQAPHHLFTNPRDDDNWQANVDFHEAVSPHLILALVACARKNPEDFKI